MREPQGCNRRWASRPLMLVAVVGGVGTAFLWSGTLSRPELLLARSYETAFAAGQRVFLKTTPAALAGAAEQKPVDAIWTGKAIGHDLALYRPLSVGERITISGTGGKPDKLTVISVEQIDGATLGSPGLRFQMITSKVEGDTPRLVRFLVAIDKPRRAAADKSL